VRAARARLGSTVQGIAAGGGLAAILAQLLAPGGVGPGTVLLGPWALLPFVVAYSGVDRAPVSRRRTIGLGLVTAAGLAAYLALLVSQASYTTAFVLLFLPLGQCLACVAVLALTKRTPEATGPGRILSILDACAVRMTFPVLDNGYVYPAATRLTGYRSATGWALVIEVFGFSPRAGSPDVTLYTFASDLRGRKGPDGYVSQAAYAKALAENPHNSMGAAFPFDDDTWQEPDDEEFVRTGATSVRLRGQDVSIPPREVFERHGIGLTSRGYRCSSCAARWPRSTASSSSRRRRSAALTSRRISSRSCGSRSGIIPT
jgi:hypothetical protein